MLKPCWISLKGVGPPATLVPVTQLAMPEYKFEIEAVAAIRDLRAVQPIARPAPGGALTADVVVIGAGLSGLQAAHDVQRQGFSCVVLEARDRVGGKTWSQPTKNGSVVDVCCVDQRFEPVEDVCLGKEIWIGAD
jgi:monoamine oxidase